MLLRTFGTIGYAFLQEKPKIFQKDNENKENSAKNAMFLGFSL